jgi:HEPN domain-containing protein
VSTGRNCASTPGKLRRRRSKQLTPFAIEARYPSVAKEVREAQYAEALEIAESVVRWAERIILSANPTPN